MFACFQQLKRKANDLQSVSTSLLSVFESNLTQLLMNTCTCKHLMLRFALVRVAFCIHLYSSSTALLSNRKLDTYLHIYLTYNDSCYFSKVTLSNCNRLELSERAFRVTRNCGCILRFTTSCVRLQPYSPIWNYSSCAIFYLPIKFKGLFLIHPVKYESSTTMRKYGIQNPIVVLPWEYCMILQNMQLPWNWIYSFGINMSLVGCTNLLSIPRKNSEFSETSRVDLLYTRQAQRWRYTDFIPIKDI